MTGPSQDLARGAVRASYLLEPERRDVVTADGWRIALQCFKASPSAGTKRRFPVVCCHGLASNHVAFDVHPNHSTARYLAGRGYDVFLVDLRGHGASERGRMGWSFEHYVRQDLPAVVAATGPAHWIGHSMGGILALAYLAEGGDQLVSAITVGSSLDYSHSPSGFHRLTPLSAALTWLPAVPIGRIARFSARQAGGRFSPFEKFNVWRSNTDLGLWRSICERGFHAVSPPVMAQLATAMGPGGLQSLDGVAYLPRLADAKSDVLMLAGSMDAQCPPEAAKRVAEALGSRGTFMEFGTSTGQQDEYGHFDLLMGKRARSEVYPHIDSWLDAQDSSRGAE